MRVEIAPREVLAASRGRLRAVAAGLDVIVAPLHGPNRAAGDGSGPLVLDADTIHACVRLAHAGVPAIPRFPVGATEMDRPRRRSIANCLAALAETGGVAGVVLEVSGGDTTAGNPAARALLGSGLLARYGMHRLCLAWRLGHAAGRGFDARSIDAACERWSSLVRHACAAGHSTALLLDGPWSLAAVARVAIRMNEGHPGTPLIGDLGSAPGSSCIAAADAVAAHAGRLVALGRLRRYAGLAVGAKLNGCGTISRTIAHLDAVRLAAGLRDLATFDTIAP